MQKFPDNEFDKWIKNSLEEPEIEFDPVAWKQMEQKLDAASTLLWDVWINNFSLIFASAIILYIFLFDVYQDFFDKKNLDAHKNIEQPNIKLAQSVSGEKTDNINKTFYYLNADKENEDWVIDNEKNVNVINTRVKNHQDEPKRNLQEIKKDIQESEQENINGNNFRSSFLRNDKPNLDKAFNINNKEPFGISSAVPKTYILFNKNHVPVIRTILSERVEEDISVKKKEHFDLPKFSFNILVSPDISSVNFSNVKGTGLNTGIAIEYYLSPRWRVSTGVIRSNKIYGVQAENGYSYGSPSQSKLESIDAVCDVLDVPINFRYNLSPAGRGGFFISSGLSSYIMLQEDYGFNYKNYNSSYTKNISVKGENKHFFQITNFSIGYEKEIGKRISIQGEPFLKVPFKDVGYGKVRLLTTGAFLSVKYKLY